MLIVVPVNSGDQAGDADDIGVSDALSVRHRLHDQRAAGVSLRNRGQRRGIIVRVRFEEPRIKSIVFVFVAEIGSDLSPAASA